MKASVSPFLLLLAATIAFSCTPEIDPLKPDTPVSPADWHAVPSDGGTVEVESVSLSFDGGTFNGDSKVAVTPVESGKVAGDDERSPFYQITIPKGGTKKEFTIKIPWDGKAGDVVAGVKSVTVCRHNGKSENSLFAVNSTYKDGEVCITVPPVQDPLDVEPFFTVGLIDNAGNPSTKAGYPVFITSFFRDEIDWTVQCIAYYSIISSFDSYARDACDVLGTIGLRPEFWTLMVKVEKFYDEPNSVGLANTNPFVSSWGYMRLNSDFVKGMVDSGYEKSKVNEFRQTLVHEFFHLVHDQYYDPRSAYAILTQGSVGDEWACLSEAFGTWTEKLTGGKMLGDNAPVNAECLLNRFYPHGTDFQTYRRHGYAMALFLEYLARKTSDTKMKTILEYQRDGAKTLHEAFQKFLKANNLTFFNEKDYLAFVLAVMNGDIDSRVDPKVVTQLGKVHKVLTSSPITIKDTVNNYGVTINILSLSDMKTLPQVLEVEAENDLKISQNQSGLVTYVYYVQNNRYYELGKAVKDEPYSLPVKELNGIRTVYKSPLVLLTTKETQSDIGAGIRMENLTVEFAKPDNSVPKIREVSFDFTFAYTDGKYTDDLCPYETTWSKSYGNDIKVKRDGKGLIVTCDNEKCNYEKDSRATISFRIDKFTGLTAESQVSNVVYDYDSGYGSVWHVELDSIPLKECEPDPWGISESTWYAKGKDLKLGKFSYEYDSDFYGTPKHTSYKYVYKDYNDARLHMEYQ